MESIYLGIVIFLFLLAIFDLTVGVSNDAVNFLNSAIGAMNDNMLQMPIITPVSAETWNVKEAMASEADMPAWGPQDERGIDMEVETAAADLAAGSDAVILRHPESVKTISKLIKALA